LGTDLELLEAWRAGDKVAGDALVSRYWEPVARFFRHKLGDDGVELISQTFLACVETAAPIEHLRAFLFTVARRRLADHLRVRARRPALDFAVSSLADLGTGLETALGRKQRAALLQRALQRIPLDDQVALELAYVEGLSTRELAAVLEINENTVRSRLARAREKLRGVLAGMGTAVEVEEAEAALRGG
jgi:RNA polymerase sigma-70 factor (ECF subfamily)